MSNHRTFTYPPSSVTAAGSAGSGGPTSEIVVTEDHATEAVQIVVRAIEFLRIVYCGGARNDAFAVPPRHVAAVEEAQVPRRPAGISGDGGGRSPTGHRRTGSDMSSGRATPGSQRNIRTTSPSQRFAGPPRPYDSVSCPESARGNPTMATGLHAAVSKISSMPYFTTVRRSGTHAVDKNAAPFVLLIRIGKTTESGAGSSWYGGGGKRLEVIEEWEFHFVKIRPNTRVAGGSSGAAGSGGSGALGDVGNSSIFRPAPSSNALGGSLGSGAVSTSILGPQQSHPTELQHALGLAPQSLTPNDPAKLRDVLHFLNMKALEAIDTFTIDELRMTPELTFEISVIPSERGTPLCHSTPDAKHTTHKSGSAKEASPGTARTTGGGEAPATGGSVVGSIGSSIASFWRR